MSGACVLDASALLCLIYSEPGAARVSAAIAEALDVLRLDIVAFDTEQAIQAGCLRVDAAVRAFLR